MQRIADDVYFILGTQFDSNTIVVLGDEPFIVDTGTGFFHEHLEKSLNEIGIKPDTIVNTHCHFDHCGGNHHFQATAYLHPPDDEHLRAADDNCLIELFNAPALSQDAQPLSKEFRGWRVIHTPGHSQGSCCLLRDNILISGDTLFAQGRGRTDLPGSNIEDMRASLALLATIDYSILLPGHGPPSNK